MDDDEMDWPDKTNAEFLGAVMLCACGLVCLGIVFWVAFHV